MKKNSSRFILVEDIFTRYTIVLDVMEQETSAYCDECDQWVFEMDGDHLSTHTQLELFELIVDKHDKQKHGVLVGFEDWTERLK